MALMEFKNIEGVMGEIAKLQKAYDLLEEVWAEAGWGQKPLSIDLTRKLDDFFGVDDSE